MHVKLFKAFSMEDLEKQMNIFLQDKQSWYVDYCNTSVAHNFLPETKLGEQLELWTAMVVFRDPEEDEE